MQNNNNEKSFSHRLDPSIRAALQRLQVKDNYHWCYALCIDYGVIAFAVYLSAGISYWFYPITIILIGSTQRAFANLLHESAHRSLAENHSLNRIAGTYLSGYLIFHRLKRYQATHVKKHHPKLGDAAQDPDYRFLLACGVYDQRVSHRWFVVKNILLPIFGYRAITYVFYLFHDRISYGIHSNGDSERLQLAAYWFFILLLVIALGFTAEFLLYWIIPLFSAGILFGWFIELAEHYPLAGSEQDSLYLSRNRNGWALENFLFGRHYDNYHLVHHLFPAIPFWNLRKAHALLMAEPSYRGWNDLWGGIFTTPLGERQKETLLSYARKYREQYNEPSGAGKSFALQMIKQHKGY